jgi:hypothetical protein
VIGNARPLFALALLSQAVVASSANRVPGVIDWARFASGLASEEGTERGRDIALSVLEKHMAICSLREAVPTATLHLMGQSHERTRDEIVG